ncbi:MAG: 50S ribosomal protein L25 [Candidatus Amesbacteria bacterium GW2011_GWA1_47_16]|uniref:Large ribosomal subunit protein bL25 n=5 Tax=Candidatus Amesiibacteriota TaxID=1752730 RepID=A0A0G1S4Z1_9BACT|nr:MAG: 50S ribosomal protein L25 [Candidatus Amesbacteria bacterium GW2011_GWC1_47_15]KKU64706.1 MAG: 50S ribosomal protein L25 [Candidatus Amesbacteria bacterium GW2011_GWA1_47_16]KKU98235.1 MAG: 50S ribosomal protein L25 [Candidatus Amesbacteria bacterium GW2011_GWB1_48_13]OGC99550.1 MAG: hypothetical protein A2701_03520 [Candidatus Amesbacteria bacterium RIFCSPHIGHO2_01_FULL_47_34]OGD01091.1 MAG: hypothetical protein A2972_04375 [Candidatus Amesbacteria bacterium RIFCSPLOWO2_01_FULL_47_33]
MAAKHTLNAKQREIAGRAVKKLRAGGIVPANLFGKNTPSVNLQLDAKTFAKLYNQVGESALIYLQIDKEKTDRPVFVKDVLRHPVTGQLLHVGFYQVDLKQKVTAPVPVLLEGEALAESEKLGIMIQQLDEVEVEALPTDMPENIKIDVTGLKVVNDSITVGDLKLDSSKFKVLTDPASVIVKIEELAAEEPVEAPAQEAAPAEGEAAEGAAPAEGETPAEEEPKKEEKSE